MAFTHIAFNDQTNHGRLLRRALQQLEDGYTTLNEILSTMTMMIDGDGSDATQFNEATSKLGFPDNATAKAAWDELNSLSAKLNTDSDITFLNAAMKQAFNKFR